MPDWESDRHPRLWAGPGFSSEPGRRLLEVWRLKIPVAGQALRLLANGVPILQALGISKGATGSRLLADQISLAAENGVAPVGWIPGEGATCDAREQ